MTLSAVHRPLNPPFRRAPGASVRPRLLAFFVGGSVFAPLFADQKAAKDPPVEDCDRYFLRKKGTKKSCGRRPRLFFFRYKRECGGLKPLPEARAGFCANMGEHANKGEHPLFACSRVRKAGFIRPRMQNADSAHTLHLRLHFITHITWVNAPCNGCNAVKRHTLFPII